MKLKIKDLDKLAVDCPEYISELIKILEKVPLTKKYCYSLCQYIDWNNVALHYFSKYKYAIFFGRTEYLYTHIRLKDKKFYESMLENFLALADLPEK